MHRFGKRVEYGNGIQIPKLRISLFFITIISLSPSLYPSILPFFFNINIICRLRRGILLELRVEESLIYDGVTYRTLF